MPPTSDLRPDLRMGRPPKGTVSSGKTSAPTVRIPESVRVEMKRRVRLGLHKSESELVRAALVEYFENHPLED
ncbi:ribbon-helix-helix DNA binding protein [Mycobacterium phage JPickles]|nr:ribbon-helix-helix DNA binding protein [Mycobacterium phage JPickles]